MKSPHYIPFLNSIAGSRSLVRDAWGDFISETEWEWFVTLTFISNVHPERAQKLFRRWVNALNRSLFGHRWYKRQPFGVVWVVFEERHRSGVVHLHGLISGVATTRRLTWMDNWTNLDALPTGWARIKAVQNNPAVSRYVSKYVAKGGEIFFSDNFRALGSARLALGRP